VKKQIAGRNQGRENAAKAYHIDEGHEELWRTKAYEGKSEWTAPVGVENVEEIRTGPWIVKIDQPKTADVTANGFLGAGICRSRRRGGPDPKVYMAIYAVADKNGVRNRIDGQTIRNEWRGWRRKGDRDIGRCLRDGQERGVTYRFGVADGRNSVKLP